MQKKGKYQLIVEKYFETTNPYSLGYNNYFIEYGLSEKSNIGMHIYHKRTKSNRVSSECSYYRIEEPIKFFSVFHKKPILNKKGWIISTQNTMFLNNPSYEQRISVGRNINKLFEGFINIEGAYLVNYANPVNLYFELSSGANITSRFKLIIQSINSYKHHKVTWFEHNLLDGEIKSAKDIWYKSYSSRVKLSTIYKLNDNYAFQIGISRKLDSRSKGNDIFTSLWIKV